MDYLSAVCSAEEENLNSSIIQNADKQRRKKGQFIVVPITTKHDQSVDSFTTKEDLCENSEPQSEPVYTYEEHLGRMDPLLEDVEAIEAKDQPTVDSLMPRVENDESCSSPFPHLYSGDVEEEVEIDSLFSYDSVGKVTQPTVDSMMPNVSKEETCSSPFPHLYTGDVDEEVEIDGLFHLDEDEEDTDLTRSLENGIYDPQDHEDLNLKSFEAECLEAADYSLAKQSFDEKSNSPFPRDEHDSSISSDDSTSRKESKSPDIMAADKKDQQGAVCPNILRRRDRSPLRKEYLPFEKSSLLQTSSDQSTISTTVARSAESSGITQSTSAGRESLFWLPPTTTSSFSSVSSQQISVPPSVPSTTVNTFENTIFPRENSSKTLTPMFYVPYQPESETVISVQDATPKSPVTNSESSQFPPSPAKKSRKPVPKVKLPSVKPAASTSKPSSLQITKEPPEDKETAERIYAILDEYAKQIRNSPDLQNKPARRRRSRTSPDPEQPPRKRKPYTRKSSTASSDAGATVNGAQSTDDDSSLNSVSPGGNLSLSQPDNANNPEICSNVSNNSENTIQDAFNSDGSMHLPETEESSENYTEMVTKKKSVIYNILLNGKYPLNLPDNLNIEIPLDVNASSGRSQNIVLRTDLHQNILNSETYFKNEKEKIVLQNTFSNETFSSQSVDSVKETEAFIDPKAADKTDKIALLFSHVPDNSRSNETTLNVCSKRKSIIQNVVVNGKLSVTQPQSGNSLEIPLGVTKSKKIARKVVFFSHSSENIKNIEVPPDLNKTRNVIVQNVLFNGKESSAKVADGRRNANIPYTVTKDNDSITNDTYYSDLPENLRSTQITTEIEERKNIADNVMLLEETASQLPENIDIEALPEIDVRRRSIIQSSVLYRGHQSRIVSSTIPTNDSNIVHHNGLLPSHPIMSTGNTDLNFDSMDKDSDIVRQNVLLSSHLYDGIKDTSINSQLDRENDAVGENVLFSPYLPSNANTAEDVHEVGESRSILQNILYRDKPSPYLPENIMKIEIPPNNVKKIDAISHGTVIPLSNENVIQGKTVIVEDIKKSLAKAGPPNTTIMSRATTITSLNYNEGTHTIMIPIKNALALSLKQFNLLHSNTKS